MQWVCYIEVQGLYAAAARSAGLAPADRPVVVLREGAVFDGCREAFTGGLVLGAPERQALRDVPRAVRVPLEQIPAGQTSRAWWDLCAQHTPYVEPVGPHQVFLALPSPGAALSTALRSEVKALVEQSAAYGFVAFAGVGASKLVARAAAQACREAWLLKRPGAAGRKGEPQVLAFVEPGQEERFLAPLPLAFLPAPPELQRRLSRLGLRSIGEAARIPEGEWLRQLGPLGHQVARWSRGLDGEPVKPAYPPRTLERRVQFQPEARERDHLEQVLARSALLLAHRLDAKGEGCQQVALALELAGGPPVRAVRTLAKLQHEVYPLQQALMGLLGEALAGLSGDGGDGFAISAMTVELGLIGPLPWQQMDLWDDQARRERQERIQRALSLLHERFPVRTARLGFDRGHSFREQMLGFADPYRWVVGAP